MYIMNRIPTALMHGVTPKKKFTKMKPYISHLKFFGCIAYVHILDEKKTKQKSASSLVTLYRQKGPTTRQMRVSRYIMFDEMSSQYALVKMTKVVDARNDKDVEHQATRLEWTRRVL